MVFKKRYGGLKGGNSWLGGGETFPFNLINMQILFRLHFFSVMLVFIVLHYPWWILPSTDFLSLFCRFFCSSTMRLLFDSSFRFLSLINFSLNCFPVPLFFLHSLFNNFLCVFFNFSLQITLYNKRHRTSIVIRTQISQYWKTSQLYWSALWGTKGTRL